MIAEPMLTINSNGTKKWQLHGKLHRADVDSNGFLLPAYMDADGIAKGNWNILEWWVNGKRHCVDKDPGTGLTFPVCIGVDGSQEWWQNGVNHRTDKDPGTGLIFPACIGVDGSQEWWQNGVNHRTDIDPVTGLALPAYIDADTQEWWVNGNAITKQNRQSEYSRVVG